MERALPALLSSLSESLEAAVTTLPEETSDVCPENGISLFNVKNELLLSYLQNLVFLIILKLRESATNYQKDSQNTDGTGAADAGADVHDAVVKRLVELRVYLEKGVRPLESRLKYQIDKVIRAADDAQRSAEQREKGDGKDPGLKNGRRGEVDDTDEDEEDDEDGDEDGASDGSSSATSEDIDDLAYRPNISALKRTPTAAAAAAAAAKASTAPNNTTSRAEPPSARPSSVYKAPRMTPALMPSTSAARRDVRKPMRSAILDEFVAAELAPGPTAEPSVGSTIVAGGRRSKSAKEREVERERREYEEANFVRLPAEGRSERRKVGGGGGRGGSGYGGEEWKLLGAGADRIERMTRRKEGVGGVLERSRKRRLDGGEKREGGKVGERFEKRRKVLRRRR